MELLNYWLQDTLSRVYPQSMAATGKTLNLLAARGETISFQVCLRLLGENARRVAVSVVAPAGLGIRVRRVGYVPLRHLNTATPRTECEGAEFLPGLCPDPLFPESEVLIGPEETTTFWVTVAIPPDFTAGRQTLTVQIALDGQSAGTCRATLQIQPLVVGALKNFPVTHWFYADQILDWYRLQPWQERFWQLLPLFFRNLTAHRQDTVYVPVFTPPLDGVKRPSQLLVVNRKPDGTYAFDWSNVRRWIRLARECGLERFEWCHFFTQWGVKYAIRIYDGPHGDGGLLWPPDTGATSPTYRAFLAQFLPELKVFLETEGLGRRSFFHVSDEPHGDEHLANYRQARQMLRELAPWMKVMDALTDIRFGREKLTDMPIPSISTAIDFHREKIPSWCYFCCGPRGAYLNRFLDTPLAKIRMAGWLFHRFEMKGFLHWGYNYWCKSQTTQLIDPFTEQSGGAWPGWAYGDTFMVYPGPDGPLDSLRWEVWAESLQDMALLQAAEVKPNDRRLASLHDFADFPKSADWLRRTRRAILLG